MDKTSLQPNSLSECKICSNEFEDAKHLHFHLRSHKVTQKEYYLKYYPRFDLLTGAHIPFESAEQYFEQDFVEKENFYEFLKSSSPERSRSYLAEKLINLSERKSLNFAPNQVYLKSYCLPSINALNRIVGNYYNFCRDIGLKTPFENTTKVALDASYFNADTEILIDTREKMPLQLSGYKTRVQGLKFGDYVVVKGGQPASLRIERKSLTDLIGTLSHQIDRFVAELERARAANAYIVVLVEEALERALIFDQFSWISQHTRVKPQFIFHQVRRLIQEFDNLQFLFVRGRAAAADILVKLYRIPNEGYRKIDLQFAYDSMILV